MTKRFVLMVLVVMTNAVYSAELRLTMEVPRDAAQRSARTLLERSHVVDDVVSVVREEFRLPRSVHLLIGGDDGPLYDPNTRQIVVPYFFVNEVAKRIDLTTSDLPADERDEVVAGVVEHTLYHELGHALIDLLDVPLKQKEEDAVDTLATMLMIESFEDGEHAALDAMEDFLALDELEGEAEAPDYFAEHSIDIERYENGVCLVYGSNPNENRDIAQELGVSEARQCVQDWKRARRLWLQRLKPILRPGGELVKGTS